MPVSNTQTVRFIARIVARAEKSDNAWIGGQNRGVNRFEPSFSRALSQALLVGGGLAVAATIGLAFSGVSESILVTVAAGAVLGFFVSLLYLIAYVFSSPRSIQVTPEVLEIERRSGTLERISWPEIRSATFDGDDKWEFGLEDRKFHMHKQGFSTEQWQEMAELIRGHLAEHGTKVAEILPDRDGD